MSDQDAAAGTPMTLAGEFPATDREVWRELVDATLKGKPYDKAMRTALVDGIVLEPLYGPEEMDTSGDPAGLPGSAPFARGTSATIQRVSIGWRIDQLHLYPEPSVVAEDITRDRVAEAVTGIRLRLDRAGRTGDPGGAGIDGVVIQSLADLETALAGQDHAYTPLVLEAGGAFEAAAALALAWGNAETVPLRLNADPLGALARDGRLPASLDQMLGRLGGIASYVIDHAPETRTFGIDVSSYAEAGATDVEDLAFALATFAAYLRAAERAGIDPAVVASQTLLTLPIGADVFTGIAKIRAARAAFARLLEACGAGSAADRVEIAAISSSRTLAERDVWVNMLRSTVTCFAAAVGGADAVTILPHDTAVGHAGAFARRIARNTQLVLMQESELARVVDPAGGSHYVESLTGAMARGAWSILGEIEAAGGMASALLSGDIARRCSASWAKREQDLARRKTPVTGVSEFPNLDEERPETRTPDLAAVLAARPAHRDVEVSEGCGFSDLVEAARQGASLSALLGVTTGPAETVKPLVRHRQGEAFERLRSLSDAVAEAKGQRPLAFRANLGTPADYTARATFAANYLAAGGIGVASAEVDAATVGDAFKASGARMAVLCSSDGVYGASATDVAVALKAAGAERVLLAGRPGEQEDAFRAAGIDTFIYMGDDTLGVLTDLAAALGVIEP